MQRGFTLIELVMVTVIVAVLAVVGLPKFIDLGQDARITAVNNFASALKTAASVGATKCATTPSTCDPSASYVAGPYVLVDGQARYFHKGTPTAWGNPFGSQTGDIASWVTANGFSKVTYVPASYALDFTYDAATNPLQCKVTYAFPNRWVDGNITVTTVTTGC